MGALWAEQAGEYPVCGAVGEEVSEGAGGVGASGDGGYGSLYTVYGTE